VASSTICFTSGDSAAMFSFGAAVTAGRSVRASRLPRSSNSIIRSVPSASLRCESWSKMSAKWMTGGDVGLAGSGAGCKAFCCM
jgi:hypothetical protein